MALRDQLNVSTRAELYNFVMQSDQVLTVLGVSVAGDIPAELWYFNATSTATDNGTTVIKPTAIPVGNPGRYVRWIQEADWSYVNNKPSFATVATTGSYSDLSGQPTIPAAQVQCDYAQVSTGAIDYIKNKPNLSLYYLASNPSGYISGITSSMVTTALGYTPYSSSNPSGYITGITSGMVTSALGYTPLANTRNITINGTTHDLTADRTWTVGDVSTSSTYSNPAWITTLAWSKITGTPTTLSGYGITDGVTSTSLTSTLASYVTNTSLATTLGSYATTSALTTGLSGKENTITAGTTLQYWRGDKTFQTLNTTVVPEGTNQYFTDARARTAVSLTTTGTSGAATYNTSTGVLNIPVYTSASANFNNAPGRSLNTSYQISTTRTTSVSYTVAINTAVSLLNLNSNGQVFLEISSDNVNWTTINSAGIQRTLSISITISVTDISNYNIQGWVPANYWVRLRTVVSGGATVTFVSGQEVQFF